MIRRVFLVLWTAFLPALRAEGPTTEKEGPPKRMTAKGGSQKGAGAAAKARPAGVAIEHAAASLVEADRTPEGEMRAILAATAVLKVDRPLRYRSTVLPPGSYPLAVSAEEEAGAGRNLFFVIGPAAGSAAPKEGAAPPADLAAGRSGPATPEEKKMEKSPEARGAGSKGAEPRGEPKSGGRRRPVKTIPGQIRALFHLTAAREASSRIELTVKPSSRGDRFTLMVRAGASEGKATLKLVD
jgi:hypothetical protein